MQFTSDTTFLEIVFPLTIRVPTKALLQRVPVHTSVRALSSGIALRLPTLQFYFLRLRVIYRTGNKVPNMGVASVCPNFCVSAHTIMEDGE